MLLVDAPFLLLASVSLEVGPERPGPASPNPEQTLNSFLDSLGQL